MEKLARKTPAKTLIAECRRVKVAKADLGRMRREIAIVETEWNVLLELESGNSAKKDEF